jgi:hypothetical protein
MSIMQGLRAYHAALGLLVIAAFLTGELGTIHAVFGYAIAVTLRRNSRDATHPDPGVQCRVD